MRVLAVDVGGTHVGILVSGQEEPRKFASAPTLTPEQMVAGVKQLAGDWQYDAVSLGYPGPVVHGQPTVEPHNLGPGWVGFDYSAAFGRPVKIINDAAMQALGSYQGEKMLFLGLGTGLGSAMVVRGIVEPMELAHLKEADRIVAGVGPWHNPRTSYRCDRFTAFQSRVKRIIKSGVDHPHVTAPQIKTANVGAPDPSTGDDGMFAASPLGVSALMRQLVDLLL